MQPFPIPFSFYLFGQKITVEWVDTLLESDDATGMALYRKNVIQLQKNNHGVIRPQSQLESSFLHELMHYIFFMLHKDELRTDEELVDTIAKLLHQAMTTAEYEK